MPWRATSVIEERLRFAARLLEGEGRSEVCREFGISRETGCKFFCRWTLAKYFREPFQRCCIQCPSLNTGVTCFGGTSDNWTSGS